MSFIHHPNADRSRWRAILLTSAVALSAGPVLAQSAAPTPAASRATDASALANKTGDQITEVVVTGVRGRPRTIANSPVPIDIISNTQITATGKSGLKQILSSVIPSLVVPAQNGGGTSASVPPLSVDGLSGDYVLVLVNGKRRHGTALINNLATVAGGSTPVDLDLIPPSAIDHIEFLRDGAAAQYGSDAIAGVINIILKDGASGGEGESTFGATAKHSGALAQQYVNFGRPFFGGAIQFALSAVHHEPAAANARSSGLLYPLVNGAPSSKEASGNSNYSSAYGNSTRTNAINLSYNLSTPVGYGLEAYSFSTVSYSDIKDARGAYRPDDLASLPQIYPNGFQAYRLIHQTDFQVAGGVKGDVAGWRWDASSTFGRNFAWLGASNTLNASLGPTVHQTSFYMGEQIFDQWTNTLDLTRPFDIHLSKPADVSLGVEHRWEQFAQVAGEPNSYINGGYVVPNDGTPFGNLWHGKAEQAGLQSFTGTTPADAGSHSRNNYAAYLDLDANITPAWYAGLAGRAEHYDDSAGNTISGKFTTRYEVLPGLAFRGSVSNGFRAPSLAEEYFSTTQNTAVGTATQQVKFLPATNALSRALGASPLTPEQSVNYSAGMTFEPSHRFRVTIDAHKIDIFKRIVKSSAFTGLTSLSGPNAATIQSLISSLNFPGLSSVQYFTNAVDTTTYGVDAVAEYQQSLGDRGTLHWSAVYSNNQTGITHIRANPAVLNGLTSTGLKGYKVYNAQAQGQLTDSTPRDRLALGADWTWTKWRVHATQTRYGAYIEPGTSSQYDEHFSAKWITDLDVSYEISSLVTLSVGANNLLNIYPDRQPASLVAKNSNGVDTTLQGAPGYTQAAYGTPYTGAAIYGTNSPFGLTGGFYYTRIGLKF